MEKLIQNYDFSKEWDSKYYTFEHIFIMENINILHLWSLIAYRNEWVIYEVQCKDQNVAN
jgi:hypothetical protein